MKKVNTIEELYSKESRFFKYGFFVMTILFIIAVIGIGYVFWAKEKRFINLSPALSKLPAIEAICEEGFKDIVTDKNDSVFLSTGLRDILAERPFVIDPFRIKSIGMKDESCLVLLLSDEKTYLFRVGFIKDQTLGSVIDSVDQITPREVL